MTISEVDLRDWDKVDFSIVTKRDNNTYENVPDIWKFIDFYEQVKSVYENQIRKIPALERKQS